MKKAILVTLITLVATALGYAQESNPLAVREHARPLPQNNFFEASCFKINDTYIVDAQSVKANSPLHIFKQDRYTSLLHKGSANTNGKTRINLNEAPTFIMNRRTTQTATNGADKVQYFKKLEFNVQDIAITKVGDLVYINWSAVADKDKNISYRLMRSIQGGKYEEVSNYTPNSLEQWQEFEYTAAYTAQTNYKLEIVKNQSEVRYATSSILYNQANKEFVVYPTPTSDVLHIDFLSDIQWAQYQVLNTTGQVLQQGILNAQNNILSIEDFAKGNYMLRLSFEDKTQKTQLFSKF